MQKITISLVIAALILMAGCAHFKKKPSETQVVQHKSADVAFTGYKTSVKVKASAREIDQYILGMTYFNAKTRESRLTIIDNRTMTSPGDHVDFRIEVLGIPFPGRFLLVQHKPGEQIWLVAQIQQSLMAILRIDLKQLDDGTRLTLKMELEDTSSLIGQFSQAVNAPEILAGLIEQGMAAGQAHFDPSTTPEQLLAQGIRGEFYDTFYQGHEVSVWINASQKRVDDYLTDPKNWETYKQKYGLELTQCLLSHNPGPCPTRIRLFGIDYPIESFPAASRPGDLMSAYWVQKLIFCRIEIHTAAEQGGTRMSLKYLMDMPSGISEEGGNILMSFLQVPQYVEQILINVNKEVEGVS